MSTLQPHTYEDTFPVFGPTQQTGVAGRAAQSAFEMHSTQLPYEVLHLGLAAVVQSASEVQQLVLALASLPMPQGAAMQTPSTQTSGLSVT